MVKVLVPVETAVIWFVPSVKSNAVPTGEVTVIVEKLNVRTTGVVESLSVIFICCVTVCPANCPVIVQIPGAGMGNEMDVLTPAAPPLSMCKFRL